MAEIGVVYVVDDDESICELMESTLTREFEAQHSPFESLYGVGEVAAAIAAGVVLTGEG